MSIRLAQRSECPLWGVTAVEAGMSTGLRVMRCASQSARMGTGSLWKRTFRSQARGDPDVTRVSAASRRRAGLGFAVVRVCYETARARSANTSSSE